MLGAVLLGIIVLFVSCSGNDDKDNPKGTSSSQLPTPAPASSPTTEPSFLDGAPGGNDPSLPAPGDIESPSQDPQQPQQPTATGPTLPANTATVAGGQNSNVDVPAGATACTDQEMQVTPVPARTQLKRGESVEIQLKIKNTSSRTCSRDVGADPQELYIDSGAFKYWSSDTCSTAKGSDVRQLTAGQELVYRVTWNGRQSSSCSNGAPSGPTPPKGQFQLWGRLGTLVSQPVALTMTS
ncbi:adhesin [Paractinoplanes deccanensis]|uniref:adhesin n=1 Tax=Paractinoplanes deccanensis TaxID=113561 RepID=UPI0027DBB2FF|nr:adhesin [Actinoplanes deccanensis]